MSRDKKFRAWDKEEECWLDPKHFYITGTGEPFTCQQGRHNITCRYQLMGTDRYIVEQFTGRFDDDHKEIYAGDKASLCTNIGDIIGVCEYDNILTQFIWVTDQDGVYFLSGVDAKIIGTIHDKELLNDND